jgi:1-acyl-sn-glycerol-3-phosphate acyltransferase
MLDSVSWLQFSQAFQVDGIKDSFNGGIKYFLSNNIANGKYFDGSNEFLIKLLRNKWATLAELSSTKTQDQLRDVTSEGRLSSSAFETQGAARLATRSHERVKEAFSHSRTANIVKERIQQRNAAFKEPPEPGNGASFRNFVTIGIVASLSAGLLRSIANLHTYGLEKLHQWIEDRPAGMPLLTVANHRSTMDDPFLMSSLIPFRDLFQPQYVRWGFCAVDMCFTNPLLSRFFNNGKVLPIRRGCGLNQREIYTAIGMLQKGDWVHVFPEGKVCQKSLGLIRRGVGKMIAVAKERLGFAPMIVPIYHEGMENVMPQKRETNELVSMLPFSGYDVYVLVGDPIGVDDILEKYKNILSSPGEAPKTVEDTPERLRMYEEICDRIAVTLSNLRQELRRKVALEEGVLLGSVFGNEF